MRDYIVIGLVFASLPLILRKPFFGILVWTWISLMNPHRLCWGLANDLPLALIVAVTLLGSLLISNEPKRIPWVALTRLLALWWVWIFVSTLFALLPADAWEGWSKVWRILLLTFIAIMLLNSRERLQALIWAVALSLGFYGIKGGIFTLLSGGGEHVWGPSGTFIGGNNEIGLALIMTLPLMRYLQLTADRKPIKYGMGVAIGLTFLAILGTQSRGAMVGLVAILVYLTLKSRQRMRVLAALVVVVPAALMFMPETYFQRMETIETYQQDGSALGRINAWWTAYYIALDRPLIGGGMGVFSPEIFFKYAPDPYNFHDVHSIYFEALGENGFVGLALFLLIGATAIANLRQVAKFASQWPQLTWMRDMASMVHVALIGYAVSGAFLGLAYFDYYYTLLAITITLVRLKNRYATEGLPQPVEEAQAPGGPADAQRPSRRRSIPRKPWLLGFDVRDWYSKL